jgi:cytochrome P450
MVADPKALQYILHSSGYNFHKRSDLLKMTEMVAGNALSCAHGTIGSFLRTFAPSFSDASCAVFFPGKDHARQRKIMAPTFFASQLKEFIPIFQDTASKVFAVVLSLRFGGY